jgi:hypothetical protein
MNWDIIVPATLIALPATIASIASLIQAMKTHSVVNHKMDEMLRLARAEGAAQGKLDEKADAHLRKGEAAIEIVKEGIRKGAL